MRRVGSKLTIHDGNVVQSGPLPSGRRACTSPYLGLVSFPDWGNVPAWLSAGSLLLAFRIFLRDRSRADRAQVDAVGVWWKIKRETSFPGKQRNDDIQIRTFVRNASDLPIEASQIAWKIKSRWAVADTAQAFYPEGHPNYPGVWAVVPGLIDSGRFLGPVQIPPQKTWKSQWQTINITHLAPSEEAWLDFTSEGVQCVISYGLFTDNAGRRWETRHQRGKQARRIRWYSTSGTHYPVNWQNRFGRRVRILKAKLREKIKQNQTASQSLRQP